MQFANLRLGRLAAVAAIVVSFFAGATVNSDTVNITGNNNRVAAVAEVDPIAAKICGFPSTTVRLIYEGRPGHEPGAASEVRYEATYSDADVRYDLTWRPGGTVVAVEELRGAKFVARAEQMTESLALCTVGKLVTVIYEGK